MNPNPGQAPTGRILVIRGGAIGDFVLTLPVLAALRQQLPGARLEVLGYPHIAQLALAAGLADAVHSIEAGPLAGFFAAAGDLNARWQEFFAGFALVVSFLYDPDDIFRQNVARASPAQFIAGPHRPEEAAGIHAARVFLKPLERLAIFDADDIPRLRLVRVEEGEAAPRPRSRSLLAVHPGSGSERKNWPEARWIELLRTLASTADQDFLIVGGEAEGDRLNRLAAALPTDRVQLARSLPLVALARRLVGCRGFLGHDSGISHLAAALGRPTLVLWGDTVEAVWRPRGDQVTILRAQTGLSALSVQAVLEQVNQMLAARGS
jgi:heptosyltransferase III